jgi:CRP-like cAMP-binding protein
MSKSILIKHFAQLHPLNDIEEKELINRTQVRLIKRKHLLLQENDICNHLTFIAKGCFRLYKTDSNGKDHNLEFAGENDWITNIDSLHNRKPSKLNIEALESSEIIQIERKDLWHLYTKYHSFDRHFRVIIENKYTKLQDRTLLQISSSSIERYNSFLNDYPHLFFRLSNTHIASYLGITPEFLSRIRGEKQTVSSYS